MAETPDNLAAILDGLSDHLKLLRELGENTVEVSPEALAALKPFASPTPVRLAPVQPQPAHQCTPQVATQCNACFVSTAPSRRLQPRGLLTTPDVCVVTDQPEKDDDQRGELYSGPAGKLIDGVLKAMGYARDAYCLTALCKCRLPVDRPTREQFEKCRQSFTEEIDALRPKIIVALGSITLTGLFLGEHIITASNLGKWMSFRKIPVMPTYHPGRILCMGDKAPSAKQHLWNHMKLVLTRLERPIPIFGRKSRKETP
ncbi:MAG: uracil-DNA glycosylase [Kiritimatiellia bacterium]